VFEQALNGPNNSLQWWLHS